MSYAGYLQGITFQGKGLINDRISIIKSKNSLILNPSLIKKFKLFYIDLRSILS